MDYFHLYLKFSLHDFIWINIFFLFLPILPSLLSSKVQIKWEKRTFAKNLRVKLDISILILYPNFFSPHYSDNY